MLKVSAESADALISASSDEHLPLARIILEAVDGKKVNSRCGELSRTPLMCCALLPEPQSRLRYMQLLLGKGAEVNSRDRSGRTALSYSCERGHLPEVKTLVQHGADPELPDLWGNTALIYAAVSGHAPVLDFLARAFKRLGLQINRANRVGNSALDVARYLGYQDCELALNGATLGRKKEATPPHGARAGAHNFLLGRSRSLASRCRLDSMDSIEEEEAAGRGSGASGFSSVLTPRPRSWSLQYGGDTRSTGLHLPALSSASIQSLYSPRPGKQHDPPIPAPLPGPLGILLTPLSASPHVPAKDQLPGCSKDTGLRRFNATYYQKRSSLPTSLLCPAPPERAPPTAQPTNPLTLLGNRLLRRFTFPEFKKQQVDEAAGAPLPGSDTKEPGGQKTMSRSETFPFVKKHPQIVHKPSVDSISSVKCEFDFQQNT
ncbi:hypothetical protein XENTR_v10013444 [Xenopus tropicalis]|uniref:Ankyrin repeat domain-containing protein 63 n=1 Tax=Xenopus tropicalis TaxID=8364 RepID=A0A803JN89_XENTR|nr:ankyrin repeat domain-containing protein 63 [Xenopus tropicalis]KAE8600893.1 hypothetical protein XENTR_v10013444 [Xenopus tropicalis]|eukprot:XP_002931794.1 PREDICTED: ankyrin repeat domain-containing protein 63-like [Xenopus tropicalis]